MQITLTNARTNAIALASRDYQRRRFDEVSQGIRQKLDYLTWLGVDVLWLSPVSTAGC